MIIICGLPGTGKTTLAKRIESELKFEYVNDWKLKEENIDISRFVNNNANKKNCFRP